MAVASLRSRRVDDFFSTLLTDDEPARVAVAGPIERQARRLGAVGANHVDLRGAIPIRANHDPISVRRPGGREIGGFVLGHAPYVWV